MLHFMLSVTVSSLNMDDFNKTMNHNGTSYSASVTEGEFFSLKFLCIVVQQKKIACHV
jgi:hypothetical protein